jgi:phage recombination protein Bet
MSSAVVTIERPARSVLVDMSTRYGMEPTAFEATVRATCMKPDKQGRVPSREEFAAFLLVAKEYSLNPLTKEIYAFAAKGGGIVPIVSIDGWVNLVNSHGACDGFEFDMEHDAKGNLVSCTCRMFRKDRSKPVAVTEYLSECIRNTEPWAMKHRMLRHKAMIQAARYAFGFSGIYDEDEGARIAEARDVTREEPPAPPPLIEAPHAVPETSADAPKTDPAPQAPAPAAIAPGAAPHPNEDPEGFVRFVLACFAQAKDVETLIAAWDSHVEPVKSALFPPDEEDLMSAFRKREHELA